MLSGHPLLVHSCTGIRMYIVLFFDPRRILKWSGNSPISLFRRGRFFCRFTRLYFKFFSQNGTTRKPVSACNRCDGRSQIRSETVILAACFHLLCACACHAHEAQLCRLHCRLCTAGFAAGFIYRSTLSYSIYLVSTRTCTQTFTEAKYMRATCTSHTMSAPSCA